MDEYKFDDSIFDEICKREGLLKLTVAEMVSLGVVLSCIAETLATQAVDTPDLDRGKLLATCKNIEGRPEALFDEINLAADKTMAAAAN